MDTEGQGGFNGFFGNGFEFERQLELEMD